MPGTPGCSCNGLRDALEEVKRLKAEREHYRSKALNLKCCEIDNLKRDSGYSCWFNCPHRKNGTYCDAVIEEVDA